MIKAIKFLLYLSVIALVAFLVWGANKGLDLSDEGLYILNLIYPEETAPYWKYGFIYNQLFGWMGLEVFGFRIVKIILLILVNYFLASEWSKSSLSKASLEGLDKIALFCMFFLSSSAIYAIGPPTLSYNDLALVYGMAVVALFIRYHRQSQDKDSLRKNTAISLALIGLVIAFLVFTKFSTAALLGLLLSALILFLAINRNATIRHLVIDLAFLLGGLLVGVIYHFLNIGDVGSYLASFKESLDTVPGHDSVTIFKVYSSSLREAVVQGVIYFAEVPIFLISIFYARKKGLIRAEHLSNFLFLLPLYLLIRFIVSDFHLSGTTNSLTALNPYLTGLISIAILVYNLRDRKAKKNGAVLIVILFLSMPFVCAIGTNNPLPLQASMYQVFWLMAFVYLLGNLQKGFKTFSYLFLLLFVFVSLSQAVHGYYFKPYRIPGTLSDQTSSLSDIRLDLNLKVHPTFSTFIHSLDSVLEENCALESPHPIISMFYDPGICYLLDGIGPGSPWFKYSNDKLNCYNVNHSGLANLSKSVIFSENGGMLRIPFIDCLNELNFNFPDGYRMIGKATHPVYGTEVFVMAPRSLLTNIGNPVPEK